MNKLNNNEFSIYNKNGAAAVRIAKKTVMPSDYINSDRPAGAFQILIIENTCNISIDGIFYKVEKGDCFIFSTNESIICTPINSEVNVFLVNILPFGFLQMIPENSKIDSHFFSNHSVNFSNRISANSVAGKHIYDAISDFNRLDTNSGLFSFDIFKTTLMLLEIICKESDYPQEMYTTIASAPPDNKKLYAVKNAEIYIEKNLYDELSLKSISENLNLSPNYLSAIFKEITGVKLWDYISEKRILHATELLCEHPDYSVLSVALACGYNNCANFNRVFKKITGITPKEYRTKKINR